MIEVGQRITYKGDMANASGKGAVVAIRSNPGAAPMFSMDLAAGKLVPFDSSKSYDVALDDGRRMNGVFSSNIGGEFNNKSCRFMLTEGSVDAAEVAKLIEGAATREDSLKAKAVAVAAEFAAAKEKCKTAGLAQGLTPAADFKGRGSAAASNLRAELKKAGIKCSVKQESFGSLRVRLDDNAGLEQAKALARKYQGGSFDGMADCYQYDPSAWGSVFGDVDYVFVVRADGCTVGNYQEVA